jgi:hypothetical protein
MTEEESFFVKHYQAYKVESKHVFRKVSGVHTSTIGTVDMQGPLQVIEEPGIQLHLSRDDYERMCKKLHEVYMEEELRTINEEAFNLWMRYRVYSELMR